MLEIKKKYARQLFISMGPAKITVLYYLTLLLIIPKLVSFAKAGFVVLFRTICVVTTVL